MYPPTIARDHPDDVAYLMAASGEELTYAELDARSNAFAHLLRRHGVEAGDSLVILLPNHLAWPVAVAAGMRTGLQVTPVNWHLGSAELTPILQEARPAAVLTDAALLATVEGALAERPRLVLTTDDLDAALIGLPTTPVDDELLGARVLFSGGTTGRPKAYHQPLLGIHPTDAPARHPGLGAALGIRAGVRFLSPAPSYHAAPFTFQLMTLAAGGTVVCLERFDPAAALEAIERHDVTVSQWVPTMLSRLLALPGALDWKNPASHHTAVTSGAPCPPDLKDAVNDWWGDVLHEYYGASEGYGHTYVSPAESRTHRGTVGRPFDDARVRVVDDAAADLPVGDVGRVAFENGSDLRGMGDMGYLDGEGYLYLTGRASFMVVTGGVNVYPEEVEAVLVGHPDVADVAVFGTPHPDLGEQVTAVVELTPGIVADDATVQRLADYCRERLAGFKVPRRFEVVDRLGRLPTGKLNKRALQEQWQPA